MCLPSEALLQHLPPYLGFSYLGQAAAAGALSAGGCSPEELPHIRGEGQKPGGPHAQRVVAKRSYPTSEVRGSGRECQAATAQKRPRGATPRQSSGAVTRGVTLSLRSGVVAGRSYPMSEARDSGREELPTSEARGGG